MPGTVLSTEVFSGEQKKAYSCAFVGGERTINPPPHTHTHTPTQMRSGKCESCYKEEPCGIQNKPTSIPKVQGMIPGEERTELWSEVGGELV